MCGIFGFVSKDGRKANMDRLRQIARATESRGRHAFGFAWIDSRGRLRMFKGSGKISDHLGALAMAVDARMLIGHCRFATQGDPSNNLNNHPHPADGGWVVHNGVIGGYEQIIENYDLSPVTDCDSEVATLLIEQLDGTLRQRCGRAVSLLGYGPHVLMGLWSQPARMIVVRSGNPLQFGTAGAGTYLASMPRALPDNARIVPDNLVTQFTLIKEGACNVKTETIQTVETTAGWETEIRRGTDERESDSEDDPNPTGRLTINSPRRYGF